MGRTNLRIDAVPGRLRAIALPAIALLALLPACTVTRPGDPGPGAGGDTKKYVVLAEPVNPHDPWPRLRYFDTGLISINDRCAVRRTPLNPKMPAVYVNGRPVGFC